MINGSEFLREIDADAHNVLHMIESKWHALRGHFTGMAEQAAGHVLNHLPHNLPETREALAHLAAFTQAALAAVDAAEQDAQAARELPTRIVDTGADDLEDAAASEPAELDPEAARVADALSPSGLIPAQ